MKYNNYFQLLIRIVFSTLILGVFAFFTPDFSSPLLLITINVFLISFDFFIGCFTKLFHFPMLKILIGFALSFISLFFLQFLTIGYVISIITIILGASIYGFIHYFL